MKAWRWDRESATTWQLLDGRGRTRCTIWAGSGEYIWHTWDERGSGGENSADEAIGEWLDLDYDGRLVEAAALIRRGWHPADPICPGAGVYAPKWIREIFLDN